MGKSRSMSAKLLIEAYCPVQSVYRIARVRYLSYALKVLKPDLRLLENVFSKQRLERSVNEKRWRTIAIVSCTRAEEINRKENDERLSRKKKSP
tara:strand:+ start:38 stop:319 length:282 start_codon:yes stop_codon:yes gene_type:complete